MAVWASLFAYYYMHEFTLFDNSTTLSFPFTPFYNYCLFDQHVTTKIQILIFHTHPQTPHYPSTKLYQPQPNAFLKTNMCLYMIVHYGPKPFSLARLLSKQTAELQQRSASEWRVERLSLNRLRELWHLKSRSQEDLNKAEKDDVFDMGY